MHVYHNVLCFNKHQFKDSFPNQITIQKNANSQIFCVHLTNSFLHHLQDTLGGGFDATQAYVGELANLNIWNRKLSVAEIYNLATCNSRAPAGNVFSWTENNIEIFGGATKWTFEPCRSHN